MDGTASAITSIETKEHIVRKGRICHGYSGVPDDYRPTCPNSKTTRHVPYKRAIRNNQSCGMAYGSEKIRNGNSTRPFPNIAVEGTAVYIDKAAELLQDAMIIN